MSGVETVGVSGVETVGVSWVTTVGCLGLRLGMSVGCSYDNNNALLVVMVVPDQ